jgi:MoxR-like ATPase
MTRILGGISAGRTTVPGMVDLNTLVTMADLARGVHVNPLVVDYIMRIVNATRLATEVKLGASVRGALALTKLAMAWALTQRRTYVLPDDVAQIAIAVLGHRIILDPEAEFDGVTAVGVISQVLLDVPAPKENGTA